MLDKRLENIREALEGPKNEATDTYVQLQILLTQRERDVQKNKYKAANIKLEGRREDDNDDKYKGVF
jgi:hypothetical protein